MMSRLIKIGSVALTAALVGAGCSSERAPRSFVQPNAIKKADLVGADPTHAATWYYIQTVTDAPPTSSFMFIGNSSELMKIRFDIQEDMLYARRAYEQIQGSEDSFTQNPSEYEGQPLAAWRISSQFDVIRDYNPTTGEETNRIIESQERPWDQREFIRVDWSQNVITDYIGLGINFWFNDGASIEPSSYWESDPTKPDALHMERADATDPEFSPGEANYVDITNKMVVTPTEKTLCYEENGAQTCLTLPACFLAYQVDDCASQIVKVRHAFSKIAPTHDYQPRLWDGQQMDQFGIWDVGLARLTYNRQYGLTNSGLVRHAARFNLWQQSHTSQACTPDLTQVDNGHGTLVPKDPLGQLACGNATLDPNGSKCDLGVRGAAPNGGLCTIPYAQRALRTIPYYAESSMDEVQSTASSTDATTQTVPFPEELFPVGQQIIGQWNDAVKNAVKDVTGTLPTQDVFVWCHNPVKLVADGNGGADPDACKANIKASTDPNGTLVYRARTGDPRRSTIFWVNQQQNAGPLGYGPPLYDPENGETVSGQAYIYGAALDTYAARSRDLVLLVTGQMDPLSYIQGANVQSWVTASRAGSLNRSETYNRDDVKSRFAAMDFSWARGLAPVSPIDASSVAGLYRSMAAREDSIYQAGIFGQNNADLAQIRRDKLRGSVLEGMMVTPDLVETAGSPGASDWSSLSEAEKWRVSPLRSHAVRQAIHDRMDAMRTLGVDFTEFADEGIAQRAIKLAAQGVSGQGSDAIRQQLRKDIFLAVTLHEVGHNMGLRHNFRASYDSMNYFPKYWELRQASASNPNAKPYIGMDLSKKENPAPLMTGSYTGADCNDTSTPLHKGHIRARYVSCPGGATSTDEELAGIREFQYTSIMDYGAEFNSDFLGLGHYDKAAMKFSYAGDGYVETFTKAKTDPTSQTAWSSIYSSQTGFGLPSPLVTVGAGIGAVAYTTYPDLFDNTACPTLAANCSAMEQRTDVPYSAIVTDANGLKGVGPADASGNVTVKNPVVPYYFCSDEFVGNLTCQRFDSGADAYEQAADIISRYNNFYLLNDFKRDRYTFHSGLAYQDRIQSRYLDILREQMTWYTLFRTDFEDFLIQTNPSPEAYLNNFFTDENGWGHFTVAVSAGFDTLGKIVSQPQAGWYGYVNNKLTTDSHFGYYQKEEDGLGGNPQLGAVTATGEINQTFGAIGVSLVDGKFIDTTWDFSACGYYWFDECETRIGYFRDKIAALDELSQSQAYFTGRDTSTDVRKYAIGYILPYKGQIEEKVGALLASDTLSVAPYFDSAFNLVNPGWALNTNGTGTGGNPAKPVGQLIDPAGGFTLQLYAGLYGLSSFPTTFDQSFIDTTKIFVVGNGEATVPDAVILASGTSTPGQTVAEGGTAQWFVWTDSESGKQYAAHSTPPVTNAGNGATYRNDTGVRMLEMAAQIDADRVNVCPGGAQPNVANCAAKTHAIENYRQNIGMMRSLHNAYGYGVYKTDAPFYY